MSINLGCFFPPFPSPTFYPHLLSTFSQPPFSILLSSKQRSSSVLAFIILCLTVNRVFKNVLCNSLLFIHLHSEIPRLFILRTHKRTRRNPC
jgi:hypothetical protein